ncbi:hypothetical protein Z951_28365 [Streptomyces sp. PRh5]|uniref:hypothetical protein n=1 Tax=Streptomyces sp. PRh5 TaxID=1158056 RepID=UPI0004525716|nr:hypothetical protein [Streptomyces sp. PRh5]EXU64888.1 hypothetical protein Z951_28365 [Streptomyces sp. PRh5]
MRVALAVGSLLADQGLVDGPPTVRLEIRTDDDGGSAFLREVTVEGAFAEKPELAPALAQALHEAESAVRGGLRVAVALLAFPGRWTEGEVEHRAERVFSVDVSVWKRASDLVTVHTYADAWLTHDLLGHPQPDVHAANAPRLRAALRAVSEITQCEPDPGDPTWYATPTSTGFEDLPDEEPELLDSWHMFEIPYRSEKLRSRVTSGPDGYHELTESPVRYVAVASGESVLGYLWAADADADAAAGYEPRNALGEKAFAAGAVWLTRLREAKRRGLSPEQALHEFSTLAEDSASGRVVPGSEAVAPSLEDLQALSGR